MRHERLRLVLSSLFGVGSFAGLAFALPALISAAPERVSAEMMVRPELCTNPAVLHGGALACEPSSA